MEVVPTLLLYWFASSLGTGFLLEQLLFFVKRKFGTKCKIWQYSTWSKFLMIFFFIYSVFFIIYQWESYTYSLLKSPACSIIYIYLKQRGDYSDLDINSCQKDTESIGAYWAHHAFDSYYKIVLQNIKERMASFEKEHDLKFLVKKLVIVVPLSCDVRETLTEKDESIKLFGYLLPIECDQGANINRKYNNPVYRISFKQDIYIAAEYPSSLQTLWNSQSIFSNENEKFNYHRDCYIKTLKFLVKDSPCIVAEFNDIDNSQDLSSFLLSVLREKGNVVLPFE